MKRYLFTLALALVTLPVLALALAVAPAHAVMAAVTSVVEPVAPVAAVSPLAAVLAGLGVAIAVLTEMGKLSPLLRWLHPDATKTIHALVAILSALAALIVGLQTGSMSAADLGATLQTLGANAVIIFGVAVTFYQTVIKPYLPKPKS